MKHPDLEAEFKAFNIGTSANLEDIKFLNILCNRYHLLLVDNIKKVMDEVSCTIDVAVFWAVNVMNSLNNTKGFSPSHLVFGYNPLLPSVASNKSPALSMRKYSSIIKEHLDTMKKARETFLKSETAQETRRVLNQFSCCTSYGDNKYLVRDQVYYQKEKSKYWYGPGCVIGIDGLFVLLRDKSSVFRLHVSKLQPANKSDLTSADSIAQNNYPLDGTCNQNIETVKIELLPSHTDTERSENNQPASEKIWGKFGEKFSLNTVNNIETIKKVKNSQEPNINV